MKRQTPLPRLWLLSDERNDAQLAQALRRLPRGSGFIYRHYHLPTAQRRLRYEELRRLCRLRGIVLVLAGSQREARAWRADAAYGRSGEVATVHSLRELRRCTGARVALLSPVFPTQSHPGATGLGPLRFLLLARQAALPVGALGGINRQTARRIPGTAWAAINGLSGRA